MEVSVSVIAWLMFFIFFVAMLYSSVGHGGASGYLAVLSLLGGVSQKEMATTALILNLLVAGIAFVFYVRAGHYSWRLSWPFIMGSVPAAFIGGMMKVDSHTYSLLLALVLALAAVKLLLNIPVMKTELNNLITVPKLSYAIPMGIGIGFLSGIVGVGGGIFLSPLIVFFKWADLKTTSATSAFFILVNSISGLFGRYFQQGLIVGNLMPLLIAALCGGVIGSYIGSKKFSNLMLSRMLAVVLFIAAFKLVVKH